MLLIFRIHYVFSQVVEGKCTLASPARDPGTPVYLCHGFITTKTRASLIFNVLCPSCTASPSLFFLNQFYDLPDTSSCFSVFSLTLIF